ncbi:hypothetical protein GM51_20565 [freshwater metagenome]|uniref:ASCH domain-containing protein n=1 Tax=freshwater metagenome TaxID=449393 RepID=A0A094QFM6_9ZZZZ
MIPEFVNGLRPLELGEPGELRSRLIDLIVNGNKRATAGALQWDYESGEPIEAVGEKFAVVGNNNEHVATIEITRVEVSRFADVPDEFALAEAEGDLTGDDFRESHLKFWNECGYDINDDSKIVLAYFELIEVHQ